MFISILTIKLELTLYIVISYMSIARVLLNNVRQLTFINVLLAKSYEALLIICIGPGILFSMFYYVIGVLLILRVIHFHAL